MGGGDDAERIARAAVVYEGARKGEVIAVPAGLPLRRLAATLLEARGDDASVVMVDDAGHRLEVWRRVGGAPELAWRLAGVAPRAPSPASE